MAFLILIHKVTVSHTALDGASLRLVAETCVLCKNFPIACKSLVETNSSFAIQYPRLDWNKIIFEISDMKRILVPCDFSTANEKAIKFAFDLADDENDELFLVNVINDISYSENLSEHESTRSELVPKFIKLSCAYHKTGVVIHYRILSGKFLLSILNFIEHEKIDLVVMGTHGSREWGEFFIGSNIEKVVRTSPVPVFAVRGEVGFRSIHNIVFPCNLKLDQPEILLKVKDLQEIFHARLHLLRVNTGKSQNGTNIIDKLQDYGGHYRLSNYKTMVFNADNVKGGILRYTREINADMIAMVTR